MYEDLLKNLNVLKAPAVVPLKEEDTPAKKDEAEILVKAQDADFKSASQVKLSPEDIEAIVKQLASIAKGEDGIEQKEQKKYLGSAGDNTYYASITKDDVGNIKSITIYDSGDDEVKSVENTENLSTAQFISQIVKDLNLDSVSYPLLMELDLLKKEEPPLPEEPTEERPEGEKSKTTPQEGEPTEEPVKVPKEEGAPPEAGTPKESVEAKGKAITEGKGNGLTEASAYPPAEDPKKVGTYPVLAGSGGGWVWDAVLEYRVWVRPPAGGDDYYRAFATYEEAEQFAKQKKGVGGEEPLVLIRQDEYIDEPEPGKLILKKGPRITEWRPEWLKGNKRTPELVQKLLAGKKESVIVSEDKRSALDNLRRTAIDAVRFVGRANYKEREEAAIEAVERSYSTGRYIDVESIKTSEE